MFRCSLTSRRAPFSQMPGGISWQHRYLKKKKQKQKEQPQKTHTKKTHTNKKTHKKPRTKLKIPQPSHTHSCNLQKLLWLPSHPQGNKQDLWIGIGFGHAGVQGHTAHHSLPSLRDALVRICFRSHWCRLGALPVLAHQLFAFSAGSPRHHICTLVSL